MTTESQEWIDGYLDDLLSEDQQAAFAAWLEASPDNRRRFVEAVLLHDRIRGELQALAIPQPTAVRQEDPYLRGRRPRRMRPTGMVVAVLAAAAVLGMLWRGAGDTPATAAVVELERLIAANAESKNRAYRIDVLESVEGPAQDDRTAPRRPPKPPLDDASLYAGPQGRFVLMRKTRDGAPFITGSDGRTSWAIAPDGPARVSSDLERFNRDLPGHEHAMPLVDLHEGLARLRAAYDVSASIPWKPLDQASSSGGPLRRLSAVKRRGFRGPRQVDVVYASQTGRIREMRFFEMPYGPDRLTLVLTLLDELDRGDGFFGHAAHHPPETAVEFEE